MKKKKDSTVTLIIVFAMFLLVFGIFYYYQYKEKKDLKVYTNETVGTIVKYKKSSKETAGRYKQTHHYHNMTINYTIDGKIYSVEKEYIGGKKEEYNIGDKIDILYDPNNPENIVPEFIVNWKEKQFKSSQIGIIISTLVATGFFAFVYSKTRDKTKKGQ